MGDAGRGQSDTVQECPYVQNHHNFSYTKLTAEITQYTEKTQNGTEVIILQMTNSSHEGRWIKE